MDMTSDQSFGSTFHAPPARFTSATAKKRMMNLLQNVRIKLKKGLKNQKALCKNQKAIVTHLSMATPEDPLILLSLSEDDFEEEVAGEAPLGEDDFRDGDEDDDGAADGDKDDEDDGHEDGGEDFEEGDEEEEESNG